MYGPFRDYNEAYDNARMELAGLPPHSEYDRDDHKWVDQCGECIEGKNFSIIEMRGEYYWTEYVNPIDPDSDPMNYLMYP